MELDNPAPWTPPGEKEIARASERLSLGVRTEELARCARMATGLEDAHRRTARLWQTSRPEPRRVAYTPGDDQWNAAAHSFHVPGDSAGPLDGLRVAVKENVAIAGIPYEIGSALAKGHLATTDATVVQRALHAGASITHTGRMGRSWGLTITGTTEHGPVRNPWAPHTHMTWGSSSGCAALVAAGLADAAIMVDQAGSGRAPAAGCGLLALMPTRGMLPMTGIGGFLPILDRVVVAGLRTRIVAQLASVLSGSDGLDLLAGPRTHPHNWAFGLSPDPHRRIGLVTEALEPDICDPAVAKRVRRYASFLTLLGATVEEVSVPHYRIARDVAMLLTLHSGVPAMTTHHLGHSPTTLAADPTLTALLTTRLRTHPNALPDTVQQLAAIADADDQPPGYWTALAYDLLPTIIDSFRAPLIGTNAVDMLLTPTVPSTPPPLPGPDTTREEQLAQELGPGITHTCPVNLLGLPALQIPADLVDGLPVGIQLTAPPNEEQTLLNVAAEIEFSMHTRGYPTPTI